MRVKDFYSKRACDKKYTYQRLLTLEDKRPLKLAEAIGEVCQMLKERKDKAQYENIVSYLNSNLAYDERWYDVLGRADLLSTDDKFSFIRLIKFLWRYKIVDANLICKKEFPSQLLECDKDNTLTQNANLICEDNEGNKTAFIIKSGKSDHSKGGKSNMTCTSTRLEALIVKSALEKIYPNINVAFLYLRNNTDEDGKLTEEFLITNTKNSNILFADFSAYYENGVFDRESFDALIGEVISEKVKKPCFDCKHARLCNLKGLEALNTVVTEEKPYELPKYTDEQKEVIDTTEGQLVCIAGPGSGKTATLVGRIKKLCEITQPERVLAITYTKKAARELLSRCNSFCKEGSMPYISTIHSFAFEILRANRDVTGREYKVLTGVDNLTLIDNLLYSYPQIDGIKYGKKYGRYGTLKTVEKKLQAYGAMLEEEFRKKNAELGNLFYSFAESYYEAVRNSGYMTYDEIIVECINLLKENEDILNGYRNLYKYIMVDEYQDVNKENAELIYLLAGENGNLCVVGDDDQAIYGFRGGSNKYMLDFKRVYPNARNIILTKNFRSLKTIVDLSASVVKGNERFDKNIVATREEGEKPYIIGSNSAAMLDEVIASCVTNGYSYSDIAILSTLNAPLESLHEELKAPTVLAKTMLIDSVEFLLLDFSLKALKLTDKEITNDMLLPVIKSTYPEYLGTLKDGESIMESFAGGRWTPSIHDYAMLSVYEIEGGDLGTDILKYLSSFVEVAAISTISNLMDNFESVFGMATPATQTIRDMLGERDIKDLEELSDLMSRMILMEDDTRVEVDAANAVTLITTHESKGKEWPCVILQNLEAYKSDEESRRTLYVACTRAKDKLFLAKDKMAKLNISLDSRYVDVAQ